MRRFFLFFLLLFAACSKEAPLPKQVVRVNLDVEPASLDPRCARDLKSMALLHMLFEGLTRVSQEGAPELALAKEVQVSTNGLAYTFSLRRSNWSNGDPLTAEDFVASWKTILDPQFPTDIAYYLYAIQNAKQIKQGELPLDALGVEAPDLETLVVRLEQPTPYFLELLTLSPFFPIPAKWAQQNSDWATSPKRYVCNGPFSLQAWEHTHLLSLSKNPHYWEAERVSLEEIDLPVVSGDTALYMFEKGELDWVGSPFSVLPVDAIEDLKGRGQLQKAPFAATYFFRVNTAPEIRGAKNPLADPLLRRALAAALDREAIVAHVLQGSQKAAKRLVPPDMGLSSRDFFDEGIVKELQISSPLTLSYMNGDRNAAIAQAVQQQWKEALGIGIELEAVEPKIFFQRISNGEFQLAAGSWVADFSDPINFLEVFKYKDVGTNNTGWERAEYIDLLNRSTLCKDLGERRELLSRAEEILLEDMPIIPLFHFTMNYLKKNGLEGAVLSSTGQLDLRWAHWNEGTMQ